MARDDEASHFQHPRPASMEPGWIGAVGIFWRAGVAKPQVGEGDQTLAGPNEGGDVLRGVAGGFPEQRGGRYEKAFGRPTTPLFEVVHRPVVVDPGIGEHADIDGVIGMVVADDDVGDLGRFESEFKQGARYGGLRRGHARIDDDQLLLIDDEADRGSNSRASRSDLEDVPGGDHLRTPLGCDRPRHAAARSTAR